MALVSEDSCCAICGQLVDITGPLFATSGTFFPRGDPLWFFCDAPMHWDCYAAWPHRVRFARRYVEGSIESVKHSPFWGQAYLDEFAFVSVNPHPPVEAIRIRFFKTGSSLDVLLRDWDQWIMHSGPPMERLHEVEKEALLEALPFIRVSLPTAAAAVQAVGWKEKEKILAGDAWEKAGAEKAKLEVVAAYNAKCERLNQKMKLFGLRCPHCGQQSRVMRLIDKSPSAKSYFICLCGRSLRADDLNSHLQ